MVAFGKSDEHLRTSSLVLKMVGATKRYVRCITLGKMEAAKEAAGNDESWWMLPWNLGEAFHVFKYNHEDQLYDILLGDIFTEGLWTKKTDLVPSALGICGA